jgi:nicotinamidase-related amidase
MTKNPNELTVENSALLLIDHQPAVALVTPSIPATLLINNVAALARAAKVLGVPTVLTTVGPTAVCSLTRSSKRSARSSPTLRVNPCVVPPRGPRRC